MRSLIPSNVHLMAMTATTTTTTREGVIAILGRKPNISYYVREKGSMENMFMPLVTKLLAARCMHTVTDYYIL